MDDERNARRRLIEALSDLRRAPHRAARLVAAPSRSPVRRLGVLPGAFNPPTLAHRALAHAAVGSGLDAVLFSLGTVTIDKPEGGLALEDRALLLDRLVRGDPALGLLLQNRGLYAEQAQGVGDLFPDAELSFVVGMDKLPQILDAGYYGDLEAALASLFSRARLLVAARGRLERQALRATLERAPASRFAAQIDWLEIDPCWREVSASEVRRRLERGESVSEWLDPEVARFIVEREVFGKLRDPCGRG